MPRASGSTPRSRPGSSGAQQRAAHADEHLTERRVLSRRRLIGGSERSSPLAFGNGRHMIPPFEMVMADDFGVPADHRLRAAIALRKPAAEVVDCRFRSEEHTSELQ